jgi:hypothetical protein
MFLEGARLLALTLSGEPERPKNNILALLELKNEIVYGLPKNSLFSRFHKPIRMKTGILCTQFFEHFLD